MLLAIDTSGHQTSIAIFDSRQSSNKLPVSLKPDTISVSSISQIESHSASLAMLLQERLRDLNLNIKSIKGIVVGAGPGSFTGLRISYSFAKGLAVAARIPLFALSSLAAAAWQAKEHSEVIVALDDARRGEFFFSAFKYKKGVFSQEVPEQIYSLQDIHSWIGLNPRSCMVTANPDLLKVFDGIVLARDLADSLGQQLLSEKYFSEDCAHFSAEGLSRLAPFYVRKVAAMTIEERKSRISE